MKIENTAGITYNNNNVKAPKAKASEDDFIKACKQALEESKKADAASKETAAGSVFPSNPSYNITDEEAEYFRDKYGDEYSEERSAELYYELADKGIISINDAARSSGTSVAMPLSAFRSVTYFGGGDPYGLRKELNRDIGFVSDRVYIKDVSRTDKDSPYKALWESFKSQYDRKLDSWLDKLQENIDFERYVRENRAGADDVFRQHRDKVIEGLEKTRDVISRIFG